MINHGNKVMMQFFQVLTKSCMERAFKFAKPIGKSPSLHQTSNNIQTNTDRWNTKVAKNYIQYDEIEPILNL